MENYEEFIRCFKNKKYFIENYCRVKNIEGKLIPIPLNEMQKDYLKDENQVIKSIRQSGKDLIVMLDILWDITFSHNSKIAFVGLNGHTTDYANELLVDLLNNCSYPMKPQIINLNKRSIEFDNGQTIQFISTISEYSSTGRTYTKFIFSEYEYGQVSDLSRKDMRKIITSILPAIIPNGYIKFISSHSKDNYSANILQELLIFNVPVKYYEYSWESFKDFEWATHMQSIIGEESFSIEYCNGL